MRRAALDDRIDVRDGDQDFDRARSEPLRHGQLVQVRRRVVVDRTPQPVAQIANRALRRLRGALDALQLLQGIGGKSGSSPRAIMALAGDCAEVLRVVQSFMRQSVGRFLAHRLIPPGTSGV